MSGPIVYTDGSCLGNPGPGGWGVRVIHAEQTVQELGGGESDTTNNRMEMQAVIAALEYLGPEPDVTVYSDSRYVLDGLTKWLRGWQRRGWVTSTGNPVKNRDLWQQLERLNRRGIQWRHVRAHTGDPNNERVDDIARGFASHAPVSLFQGQVGAPDDPVEGAVGRAAVPPPATSRSRSGASRSGELRYVSIVNGVVAVDTAWPACAARVKGVSRARYKKVRTQQEMAAFCAEHGVDVPAKE